MRRNAATVGAATATRRTSNGGNTMGPSLRWTKWPFVSTATPQPSAAPRPRSQASRAIAVTRTDVANDIGGSKAWGGQENSSAAPTRGSDTVIHILNDDGNVAPSCSTVEGEQGYTHAATPSHQPWLVEGDALHTTEVEGDVDFKGAAFKQAIPPIDDTVNIGGPAPADASDFHEDKPAGNVDFSRCSTTADADAGPTVEKKALDVVKHQAELIPKGGIQPLYETVPPSTLASRGGHRTSPSPQTRHVGDDVPVYVPTTMSAMEARTWPRDGNRRMTSREKNDYFFYLVNEDLDRAELLILAENECKKRNIVVEASADTCLTSDCEVFYDNYRGIREMDASDLQALRKSSRCNIAALGRLDQQMPPRLTQLYDAIYSECRRLERSMDESQAAACDYIDRHIKSSARSLRLECLHVSRLARTALTQLVLHYEPLLSISYSLARQCCEGDDIPAEGWDHVEEAIEFNRALINDVDTRIATLSRVIEEDADSNDKTTTADAASLDSETSAPELNDTDDGGEIASPSLLGEVEGDAKEDTASVPDELRFDACSIEDTAGVVEGHEAHTNDEAVHGQLACELDSTDGTMSQSLLDEFKGDDMAEEIVRLETSVRSRDDEVVGLQETVTRLQGDLGSLRNDVTSLTAQRDTLTSLLQSRDDDVTRLQDEVTRLLDDLASAKAMIIEAPTEEASSSGKADSPPVQVVFDEDGQVTKPVSDALHGASWASVCEEDEEHDARDTAGRDITRTHPLGAWTVPPQLKGVGDTSTLPQQVAPPHLASNRGDDKDACLLADHVATPRFTSSSRGDNAIPLQNHQAKQVASPRFGRSKVRILRRPGASTNTARATTDTPRLQDNGLELCAPSRSVVDKSRGNMSRRRKGASTDNTQRQKNGVAPVSRGALIYRQQASWAVKACHVLSAQLASDRTCLHNEVGRLRLLVAELIQRQTGHSNDESFTEETVLETIPEESTVLSTVAIASTITDGRCASVEDSSDTRRKRIGFPSEIVRPMDSPGTGLISPSARDDRVATDVLSGDGSPLRQFLTEVEQSTDGDPAQNDEDDIESKGTAFEQAAPPADNKALLSPTAVEGDADSSTGTVFDHAAPPTDVTVLHSRSTVEGDTKRGGDDIHRSTLQGDSADDALQSIELSASNINDGVASPSHSRFEIDANYGGADIRRSPLQEVKSDIVPTQWDGDYTPDDVVGDVDGDASAGGALLKESVSVDAVAPSIDEDNIHDLQSVLTAPLTAFTLAPTSVDCIQRTCDVDNDNLDEDDGTPSTLRESPITQRNDVHPLQSVLAAPVLAFHLAPASSDDIFRQIDTNNRLESQDEGLPPKPKRKRRRHRRRRRKRGRKKTTRDLLIHSPMTHPQEFRAVFNSAATKSLPLSGFDGPGDTSKLTYTTSRQPDPSNNATRSKFPTIKNADKSFPSASPLDISRARNDTVSCTLSSFVHDLEAELDAAILGFV